MQLENLGREGVLALVRNGELRFDRMGRTGVVFHMLSSLDQLGRVGYTAIADSADEADAVSRHVEETLGQAAEPATIPPTQRPQTVVPRVASAAAPSR
jgi:PGM1 C-terminal domain